MRRAVEILSPCRKLTNYDEDRSHIRTGHGPQNITRLRRFGVSLIKSKGARSVAQKIRQLTCDMRLGVDDLRMAEKSLAYRARD